MGNIILYSSRKERQTALIQGDDGSFVIMLPVIAGFPNVNYCNDLFLVGILMSKNFIFLLHSLLIFKVTVFR
jgi:hypothetical protein